MALFHKTTSVLIVERVEPVLPFWSKVMYQTVASITGDTVASATDKKAFRLEPQQATLYVEVGDLAQVESQLKGERLIMPRRKTFYGAMETGYADPAGNIVIFSEHGES